MASEQNVPERIPPSEVGVRDGAAWYRGSRPFEELEFPPVPGEVEDDYNWAQQDPRVQREYAGLVVAVYRRTVWGAGKTHRAALRHALQQSGCPRPDELVLVAL